MPSNKVAVAQYIEQLTRELARLARKERLEFLACFLELAVRQAADDQRGG